jgi:putative membrane-bound dehydrogenase-like protein
MKYWALAIILAALPPSPAGPPAAITTQVRLNGHTFTLPAGFEIELVAGPPLVDRPIVADFDEQGRLYVADSSGSNDKVQQQLEKKPHRILRLEDSQGNGHLDRRAIFADKMMFPEGVLCFAGSVYVAAPPSIWKLTDTNGQGLANQRTEWFQGKTLTRCANDLHGPYLGPDGWIYWCKGAFAEQRYDRPGRAPFVTRAAHIFRCRPDGSGIEPVMTGGMDNPVKVVFTPGGERIFTTTFLQYPGGGRRDGLIHAVYGGVYGKDHDVLDDHQRTGPALLPPLTHLGPAAPAGITRYESQVFGAEYQDNLFVAQFNMHKVSRHVLEPYGATFRTTDEDFLVSDNLDFHPTDVLEDADGSLIVIDTGGWYKICCPTSQLHKPDILGAIYRIRRKGAPRIPDPRGLTLAWSQMTPAELVGLLDDRRPAVRGHAVQTLAERGVGSIAVLAEVIRTSTSQLARCNAIWAVTRIEQPAARALARIGLADRDETVRQAAIHSVSVWRDREALPQLLRLVRGPSPQNQRAAAEALGRIGDRSAVPALLDALRAPVDRILEHSLVYALIEIGDRTGTAAALASTDLNTRRATLIALDQMNDGKLLPASVTPELASSDPAMKETAWWIVSRHVEWGNEMAGFFRDRLNAKGLLPPEQQEWIQQLAAFARAAAGRRLLGERLADTGSSRDTRRLILRAMAMSKLKEAPREWNAGLTLILAGEDKDLIREAVAAVRALPSPAKPSGELLAALLAVANNPTMDGNVRLTALAALPAGVARLEAPLFKLLLANLDREQPIANRSLAAEVLGRARLTSEQLVALTEILKHVSPLELDRLLDAFPQSTEDRVGQSLIAALLASSARSSLRPETLKPRIAKFSPSVQRQAEDLFASLKAETAKQQARLEQLLAGLHGGDVRRGQLIFNSTKAACSSCHAVGYLGGNIGPDLTRIGSIRSERDLLEAIVFPSASLVRSYEPVVVTTKDGKFHNGLVRKDAADELVLVTGVNQEVRIARQDVEDIQPSKVSIMPAGLDQQLSARELTDLVAFLRACK